MLFLLVLMVGISPRLSLQFLDAEIRVQDLMVPFLLLYLAMSISPRVKHPIRQLLGVLLPLFLFFSFAVVALSLMLTAEVSVLRRVAYYGRTIELFAIAAIVAGLYLRSGPKAFDVALRGITAGALLNLGWFIYQTVSGDSTTLFGTEVSDDIESYGPRLLGEPSAFGVGQYWAFIAAVAAARIKNRKNFWFSVVLLVGAFWGAVVAESRISVGAILVIAGLLLTLGPDRRRPIDLMGILTGVILIVGGFVTIVPQLGDRFSREDIASSIDVRVDTIWSPQIQIVLDSPLIGIGPGGLLGEGNQSEAHNIVIRAMLDFGILVGALFLGLFVVALVRSYRLARSTSVDTVTRTVAYLAAFSILATLISGMMQDSLTAVMSSHLTMIAIGLIAAQRAVFFHNRKEKDDQEQEKKNHAAQLTGPATA